MAFGDYSAQPETKFSSTFVINKNLNLPSDYKKKPAPDSRPSEVDNLLTLAGHSANDSFTVNVPQEVGGTGVDITLKTVSYTHLTLPTIYSV